jgi:hypothetical protein
MRADVQPFFIITLQQTIQFYILNHTHVLVKYNMANRPPETKERSAPT